MLRERHPTIVDTAAMEIPDLDPELVERPEEETTMLNLLSADVTARVDGINALFASRLSAGAKDISDADKTNLSSSILSRLSDSDVQVLDALYKTSKHRDIIAQVCPPHDIIDAVKSGFKVDKLNDEIIRRHLSFTSNNLVKAHPQAKKAVFEALLFPVLLSTKGRSLSAATVEVVKNSTLGGTSSIVKAALAADLTSPADLAKRIAGTCSQYPSTSRADYQMLLTKIMTLTWPLWSSSSLLRFRHLGCWRI